MRTELRRPFARRWAAIALVLSVAAPGPAPTAFASDPLDPAAAVADEVARALAARDDAAVTRLARSDVVDPWHVADALLLQGAAAAATAFARADPRPALAGLSAYVEARSKDPTPPPIVADRSARRAALAARDPSRATAPLSTEVLARSDVAAVDVRFLRARALLDARRNPEAIEAFGDVEKSAAAIGWTARRCAALEKSARASDRRGDYAGGLAFDRTWLALEESLGCREGQARAQWHEGLMLDALGRLDEAQSRFEDAGRLAGEAGDSEAIALALGGESHVAIVRGDFARALDRAESAIAASSTATTTASVERFEPDPALRAQNRANYGIQAAECEWKLGRREKAHERLDAATRTAKASGYPAGAVPALRTSASFRRLEGDLLGARDDLQQAAALAKDAGNVRFEAAVLRQRAGVLRELGDPISAEADLRRLLAPESTVGDVREEALARRTLALVLADRGEIDAAVAEADRALAIARKIGDPSIVGEALRQRGGLLLRSMAYGSAFASYEAAAKAFRDAGLVADAADTTVDWAIARQRAADRKGSLPLLLAARREAKAANAFRPLARAALVEGVARLLDEDADGAQPLLAEAATAFEKTKDTTGLALTRRALARARLLLNDPKGAQALARQALETHTASRDLAQATLDRVVLAAAIVRADPEHGNEAATAVVAEGATAADDAGDTEAAVEARWALAGLALASGRAKDAAREAAAAIDLVEALGRDLGEGEDAEARSLYAPVAAIGASASLQADDPAPFLRFVESGRARSLLRALGSRDALVALTVPEPLRRAEAEARAAESVARAGFSRASLSTDRATRRSARDALDAARDRVREAVARIQREQRGRASLTHPTPVSLATLQEALRPGEAFVAYAGDSATAPAAGSTSAALVVTVDAARLVRLPDARAIAADAEAFDPAAPTATRDPLVARLRAAVVEPLDLPASVRRVIVSPAGPEISIPFRVLVPDREVVMAPSASTYAFLAADHRDDGHGVLALGDPDYGKRAVVDDMPVVSGAGLPLLAARGTPLLPLPATRDEVRAIGDRVLVGADATRRGLVAALDETAASGKRWRAVHLACHGLVDVERPLLSALALSPEADDTGFVTALDVYRMRIPAELVVLSACETAKGKWVEGEGVLGFVRAFLFAGSRRVIASLWKVDDQATQALMKRFYALWDPKDGTKPVPAAEALARAQGFVRSQEKWRDPVYWAAWQLWGLP